MVNFPVGISHFSSIIESGTRFVDKTAFIEAIINAGVSEQVVLITRPRRFGKTFNLSMLHHFLSPSVDGKKTENLFDGLYIAKNAGFFAQHQGKYSTIFLSLKETKSDGFDDFIEKTKSMISTVFSQHRYLLESPHLTSFEKSEFEACLTRKADKVRLQNSLSFLTKCLFSHDGRRSWLLMDEYDTPMHEGYANNYWKEISGFMRAFLGSALKDNPFLDRAVITGILQVSKESLFSDLNNVVVHTLLDEPYSEYFGFTEAEVIDLLKDANLSDQFSGIKAWYNGYSIGKSTIYNPWSIVNCLRNQGKLEPYWSKTSENKIIRNLLVNASAATKQAFQRLLQGESVTRQLDKQISTHDLFMRNDMSMWTLLLMSGYLNSQSVIYARGLYQCELNFPNQEVRDVYYTVIQQWLSAGSALTINDHFLADLLAGDISAFEEKLKILMEQVISVHDVAGVRQEKFYHGLLLGAATFIDPSQYRIESNKESGYGRFDLAIIPSDPKKSGIILEVKSVAKAKVESLQSAAEAALVQIEDRAYVAEFRQSGIASVLKVGIAFCGKVFQLAHSG